MMPRACAECTSIQHVFFTSQEEFDEWSCPVCNGRIEETEENNDSDEEKG